MTTDSAAKPWARLLIVGAAVVALVLISKFGTGTFIPRGDDETLLFQSSLLLVVFGSALVERPFTRPAEALVNSVTAFVTILTSYSTAPRLAWWMLASFLLVMATVGIICISLQSSASERLTQSTVQRATYMVCSVLGQARIIFSVVFLFSIGFFIKETNALALTLVAFWGVFMALWPLRIPELLSRISRNSNRNPLIGTINRVDSPGVIRIDMSVPEEWRWASSGPYLAHLHDKTTRWCIPLFSEERAEGRWGTLLLSEKTALPASRAGTVTKPDRDVIAPTIGRLMKIATGDAAAQLSGLVREGSTVSELRVEVLPYVSLAIGDVLAVQQAGVQVLYQVVAARTDEEAFHNLQFGTIIASSVQIGCPREDGSLSHYPWVPSPNTEVFKVETTDRSVESTVPPGCYKLGGIPGTDLSLYGEFVAKLQSHTAVLGATGTGKTEFAFDLLRHAARNGAKVICIDLTAQYASRLDDLGVTHLTIDDTIASNLSDKLFAAETGAYGGGAEKQALEAYASPIRDSVRASMEQFLADDISNVGLIELREISNTKATLWITETYLTTLLRAARDGVLAGRKVLVVVEEAHTVMPESSSMGIGDYDSRGTVSKIAQIALQGRKYGVGLLVIAQRTATVSKTVLTQCNTVISFSCVDDTSINFLRNVFGGPVAESLPELRKLRAVAQGDWIRSEKPVVFDVPFDESKVMNELWTPSTAPPATPPATPSATPPTTAADEPPF